MTSPVRTSLLVIPAGAVVYRTAVSAPGVKAGWYCKVKAATGLPTAVRNHC
jgi:hypothetical protein